MSEIPRYTLRRIFKSAVTSQNVIRELLQMIFVAELLSPGRETWIVSPWISDVTLLDNRAGGFDMLNPDWGRKEVRLVEVAVRMLACGSRLIIVTRPVEHNRSFLERLRLAVREQGVDGLLTVIEREALHTKGILTDKGLLLGSMNLTYSGMELNDEVVEYDIDPVNRANARLSFATYLEHSP